MAPFKDEGDDALITVCRRVSLFLKSNEEKIWK